MKCFILLFGVVAFVAESYSATSFSVDNYSYSGDGYHVDPDSSDQTIGSGPGWEIGMRYDEYNAKGRFYSEDDQNFYLDFYGCRYQLSSEDEIITNTAIKDEGWKVKHMDDWGHVDVYRVFAYNGLGVALSEAGARITFHGRLLPVKQLVTMDQYRGNIGCNSRVKLSAAIYFMPNTPEDRIFLGIYQPDRRIYAGRTGSFAFLALDKDWMTPKDVERMTAIGDILLSIGRAVARSR